MAIGCELHTAYVYDRGGKSRIGQIMPLTQVKWERKRDDISIADISTTNPGPDCLSMLQKVQPGRHELVIFRGQERVWEGPITRIGYYQGSIQIEARDVFHYAYRTIMRAKYNNAYPNIGSTVVRAKTILNAELARKEALSPPINVLPYLTTYEMAADAQTSRSTVPYENTVYGDIDSMAQYSGMDYTVIGRRILIFDTHTVFYTTPMVTEADFLGEAVITVYGMELATHAAVFSSTGNIYGVVGANDPYYGEWEILDAAYDEDGTDAPTKAALTSQAQRNLAGRLPAPLVVRVPDNSTLNPSGALKMTDLVPGARIPLRATLTAIQVTQQQKLDDVQVSETGEDGETIQVTMSPASDNDIDFSDD